MASIMLVVYLPMGLRLLAQQSAERLTERAQSTPLLVGAKGSALDLVLSSLYFDTSAPELATYSLSRRIAGSGLATAIPLYVRFRAANQPIVGTSIEYFSFRRLELAEGRLMAMIGECVLGASAAEALGATVGGSVMSSPESVFDVAGVYPLKMPVVGVLQPTYTADDAAVFVDLKTAWIIEGLVHGHQDMTAPEAAAGVLSRDGTNIVANASVMQYNEITTENAASFHFHGDVGGFPLSSVIAVPNDRKSGVILRGRFEGDHETVQMLRPTEVMEDLLDTVLTVQAFVIAGMIVVGAAALATTVLVFVLSFRIRRREIETMVKIGGSKGHIRAVLTTEVLVVVGAAVTLATGVAFLTERFAPMAIRAFLLS
jgi:putative ABC transport system permease protein